MSNKPHPLSSLRKAPGHHYEDWEVKEILTNCEKLFNEHPEVEALYNLFVGVNKNKTWPK